MSQSNSMTTWTRILKLALPFWISSVKFRAWTMVAVLVAMWGAESYIMFLSSNASNHMMTALSEKHINIFWHEMMLLAGSYVLLTALGVSCYYLKKILELNWREWLTTHLLDKYLDNRGYYRISTSGSIDNPDERLSDDIGAFVRTTLSFFDIFVSNTMSLFTFCVILWKIWPPLILIAVVFSIVASLVSLKFGARLNLKQNNFTLIKNDADFRYELFHLRTNAESIAFYGGESEKRRSILDRFRELLASSKKLLKLETIYDCYTSIYNHLTNWLPLLILAPRFFAGDLKLGDLTQAQGAFSSLLHRCSMIVSYYDWFAHYSAITERLFAFVEHAEAAATAVPSQAQSTGTEQDPSTRIVTLDKPELSISNLKLFSPGNKQLVIDGLSISLAPGKGLAISGPPGCGKTSLLRAINGLWNEGNGLISRPSSSNILFIPQKPFMPIGTLREQLCFPRSKHAYSDEQLMNALEKVNLPQLAAQYGGLDAFARWQDELSPGQQQLLSFARVILARPKIVVLDEATAALDSKHESMIYEMLLAMDVSFVSIVHKPSALRYHDEVLVLAGDSSWELKQVNAYLEELACKDFMSRTSIGLMELQPSTSVSAVSSESDTVAALRKLLRERMTTEAERMQAGAAADSAKDGGKGQEVAVV